MPVQDLAHWQAGSQTRPSRYDRTVWRRRLAIFAATLVLTAVASYEMYQVVSVVRVTNLQIALLIVFTVTFGWIALPCVTGFAGFFALWRGRSVSGLIMPAVQAPPTLTTRTALLLPIYNEAPQRIFAAVQAMYESLQAVKALPHFDFFILSDTTEPSVWLEEEVEFWALRRRIGGGAEIFYRHRPKNTYRKAGNIADFCQRWGARYEHMVVLDADSLITGETLVWLAAAMEANPQAGLIQTVPLVVNRNTLFARVQQFAARLYGPVIAAGVAYWHRGDSSYWGHNAIIRTMAFINHAGLPVLPGHPPFGGHILSHDFVEAALLRRAGWKLYLVPEITGSYEECPPSLIDFADRDRRWCQGNLQHLRVVPARGLYWVSRLHLLLGIMSYLASPIWLGFILLGLLLALQAHFIRPEYFPKPFALFPAWPIFDPVRAVRLFIGTMSILLTPKLLGFLLLCKDRQAARGYGGLWRAGLSVLFETFVSALIAPVLMGIQSAVVFGILTGRDIGWKAQRRDDGSIPFRAVAQRHRTHMLFGIILALAAYAVAPPFLAWLSPVVLGLVLAIPVSAVTGQQALGRAVRRYGLLVTPEETEPPAILQRANELADELASARVHIDEPFAWLAREPRLRTLHASMLCSTVERRKGDYDVDLLVGLAKLQDTTSLPEASALLSSREKLMVLAYRSGFERLCQLATAYEQSPLA
jgi:membrane glycosyltransferase